jgi:hypothetical protein
MDDRLGGRATQSPATPTHPAIQQHESEAQKVRTPVRSCAQATLTGEPSNDNSPASKKVKKALKNQPSATAMDVDDRAALDKRAQRFQREHEIEREKSRNGGQASLKANYNTSHLFNNSRSASPFGAADDPEADPVRGRFVNGDVR